MKIASTLTNNTPNETGLPSLLSCGANAAPSSLDVRPGALEDRKTDPSKDNQSITAFDAVLAMFTVPQNLPQAIPTSLPEATAPTANNALSDANSSLTVPTLPAVDDQNEATSVQLGSDVVVTIGTQTAIPSIGSPQLFAAMNEFAANLIPTPTAAILPEPAHLIQELSTPSPVTPNSNPAPTQETDQPTTNRPSIAAANLDQPLVSQSTSVNKLMVSTANQLEMAESAKNTPQQSKEVTPSPVVESRLSRLQSQSLSDDSSSESTIDSKVFQTDSQLSTDLANTVAVDVVIDHISSRNFAKSLSDSLVSQQESSEERFQSQRHASSGSSAASETVISTGPLAAQSSDHGSQQVNIAHLTEQVSAAMEAHAGELTAGQPVEVHLRLDPPELGMIRVHLRLSGEGVSVRFIAGDEAVTKLLESQLPDLRQSLAERGLSFLQCDVSSGNSQQQSSSFGRDSDQPTFTPRTVAPRSWFQPSSASRASNLRSDRVDVLA